MHGDDIGRLIYLVLLAAAIGGYFLVAHRDRLGQVARQAALWGLIFLGVIAAYGLWSDIRREVVPQQAVIGESGRIEVPRAPDGHYYLALRVNGVAVPFVVDTGASEIVLSRDDALRVGIDPGTLIYSGRAGTANGEVRTARVRLDELALGPIVDRGVAAWVNQGDMRRSLLGMTYLQRFARLEIADGTLILER